MPIELRTAGPNAPASGVVPLSFVVGVSDDEILSKNFMASPCVPHRARPTK